MGTSPASKEFSQIFAKVSTSFCLFLPNSGRHPIFSSCFFYFRYLKCIFTASPLFHLFFFLILASWSMHWCLQPPWQQISCLVPQLVGLPVCGVGWPHASLPMCILVLDIPRNHSWCSEAKASVLSPDLPSFSIWDLLLAILDSPRQRLLLWPFMYFCRAACVFSADMNSSLNTCHFRMELFPPLLYSIQGLLLLSLESAGSFAIAFLESSSKPAIHWHFKRFLKN